MRRFVGPILLFAVLAWLPACSSGPRMQAVGPAGSLPLSLDYRFPDAGDPTAKPREAWCGDRDAFIAAFKTELGKALNGVDENAYIAESSWFEAGRVRA